MTWSTLIEPVAAIEGLGVLSLILGVIEVFTTSEQINGLIIAWAWKLLQSPVLFVVWDEICIVNEVQFLG